jgi:LacI family transcriptional regulator/LacI family xylobiose transport system transcriptional regulator
VSRPTGTRRKDGVTAAQIAEESGVSLSTVSKVLNGRHDVSAATRRRVQELIAEHGYRPRPGRADRAPALIDLVFERYNSEWATEIVRSAVAAAEAEGLAVVVTSLDAGADHAGWIERMRARGSRGVILIIPRLEPTLDAELRALGLPIVALDPRGEPDPAVVTVGATNWSGGLAATRHLVELGHERIAVIGGHADMLSSRARVDGHRAALETAGIPVDADLVRWSDFQVEGGLTQAEELLSLRHPPTAIFAGNDLQALGVLEAARRRQLRVPEDLSVVGFDDLPISRWTSPPLTTVRQPFAQMIRTAVGLLLSLGQGEAPPHHGVELATSLVVRASTAPRQARRR